ncbi:hypothetical protein [Photobacterium sp. Hal280]|uniref:hypothetical protein n=1 Tax=Photobacterium sp. Hal280 TaxID=3035163 RepID=UPI00301D3CF0
MKPLVYSLIGLSLAGCSKGVLVSIPENLQSTELPDTGFLVGSIGASTIWPSTGENLKTTLYFSRADTEQDITVTNSNDSSDFRSPTTTSSLFSVPLPSGDYLLHTITFIGTDGRKTVHTQTDKRLDLTFSIQPGEVTYLGEFIASSKVSRSSLWNTDYPNGRGYLTHSYALERDRNFFYEHHPELSGKHFNTATLQVSHSQLLKLQSQSGPES